MRRRKKSTEHVHCPAPKDGRASIKFEKQLAEVLNDLAKVLVASGYGITRFNRLTRRAYFEAALSLNSKTPKKPSNARIAAQTGLTRIEVARLSRERTSFQALQLTPVNRAERVTSGWVNDQRFCNRSGQPSALRFAGKGHTFSLLVKTYSGDIPARAMLQEMQRLQMVRVANGEIRLIGGSKQASRRALYALGAMGAWINFHAANDLSEGPCALSQYRISLKFSSLQQALSAVREIDNRVSALAHSVEQIGQRGRLPRPHMADVSLAFAATAAPGQDSHPNRSVNSWK